MKNNIRKVTTLALCLMFLMSSVVSANYKDVISIGADLSEEQKNNMLIELGDNDNVEVIEVTNEEEYYYLGDIIPREKIGSQALSCARIIFQEPGTGLSVDVSGNINYITESIYKNALSTAGITDATVVITAPMSVTGTGALTGVMKAYEISTGKTIDEDIKKVANEELILTADLADDLDEETVTALINELKHQMENNMPENKDEAKTMIIQLAKNIDLQLTDDQVDKLADLVMKMKNLNIDWGAVADNAIKHGKKVTDFLSSEEGQGFLVRAKNIINSIFNWIIDFFK